MQVSTPAKIQSTTLVDVCRPIRASVYNKIGSYYCHTITVMREAPNCKGGACETGKLSSHLRAWFTIRHSVYQYSVADIPTVVYLWWTARDIPWIPLTNHHQVIVSTIQPYSYSYYIYCISIIICQLNYSNVSDHGGGLVHCDSFLERGYSISDLCDKDCAICLSGLALTSVWRHSWEMCN